MSPPGRPKFQTPKEVFLSTRSSVILLQGPSSFSSRFLTRFRFMTFTQFDRPHLTSTSQTPLHPTSPHKTTHSPLMTGPSVPWWHSRVDLPHLDWRFQGRINCETFSYKFYTNLSILRQTCVTSSYNLISMGNWIIKLKSFRKTSFICIFVPTNNVVTNIVPF